MSHRETSGVAAVQSATGPNERLIVCTVYVPDCEAGTSTVARPVVVGADVASVSPFGSSTTS